MADTDADRLYEDELIRQGDLLRTLKEERQQLEAHRNHCHEKVRTDEKALSAQQAELTALEQQIIKAKADIVRFDDSIKAKRSKLLEFDQLIETKRRAARSIIEEGRIAVLKPMVTTLQPPGDSETTLSPTPNTPGIRRPPPNFEYDLDKLCYEYSCSYCEANVSSSGDHFAGKHGVISHMGAAHKFPEDVAKKEPNKVFWPEEKLKKLFDGEIVYEKRWGLHKPIKEDSTNRRDSVIENDDSSNLGDNDAPEHPDHDKAEEEWTVEQEGEIIEVASKVQEPSGSRLTQRTDDGDSPSEELNSTQRRKRMRQDEHATPNTTCTGPSMDMCKKPGQGPERRVLLPTKGALPQSDATGYQRADTVRTNVPGPGPVPQLANAIETSSTQAVPNEPPSTRVLARTYPASASVAGLQSNESEEPLRKKLRPSTFPEAADQVSNNHGSRRRTSAVSQASSTPRATESEVERSLFILKPSASSHGAKSVYCREEDIFRAVSTLGRESAADAAFTLDQVTLTRDGSGFTCVFATKRDVQRASGRYVVLCGQKLWLRLPNGATARLFQLDRTSREDINSKPEAVIRGLLKFYPKGNFALYPRRARLGPKPGYWIEFEEPVIMHREMQVDATGSPTKGKKACYKVLMALARTVPCEDCYGTHVCAVCPLSKPLKIKHSLLDKASGVRQ